MPRPATVLLTIAQPCAESWDAMTPASGGRHCAACQKIVVDFTHKTDAEILAYLKHANGASCGQFRAGQLARPLLPAAPASRWRSWLSAVLAVGGVLGAGRAAGQTLKYGGGPESVAATNSAVRTTSTPTTPVLPEASVPTAPRTASGLFALHGVVADAQNNTPLPGVMVLLEGTNDEAVTDSQGQFVLQTNTNPAALWLSVQMIGYVAKKMPAANALGAVPATVRLEGAVTGNLEVISPFPWHPRALFSWTKYQLTRPFRR